MKLTTKLSAITSAIICAVSFSSQAASLDTFAQAVKESDVKLQFRYRIETVDQDGKADDAFASTLKSRLTWTSGKFGNFTSLVEVDNVSQIGNDLYNSTNNGKTNYPVVADPKGTDLNQVAIKYQNNGLTATVGRQRINLGDQRFVGGVGWRQNEQTYDGLRLQYKATDKLNFDYSYIYNINRIFGPDDGVQKANFKGDFHLVNANFAVNKDHKVTAFAYLLDNQDAFAASSNTYGIDYTGNFGVVTAKLSYASQSDAGDNPNDFTANYYKAELSGKVGSVKLIGGYEVLGSDNGVGFSTPLATLHKWQGFADKFLGTPANGIQDAYITAVTKVQGVTLVATYHDFQSDKNSMNYGSEIDLVAKYKLNKHTGLLAKFASYNADELATDTSKFWLMATMNF